MPQDLSALKDTAQVFGSNLVAHPVAYGTIGFTERAGELLLECSDALEAQAAEIARLKACVFHESQCVDAAKEEIARQREVIAAVNSRCDHLGMRLGEVIKERDGLRVDAERWAAECNKRDDHISGWLAACAFIDLHVADPDLNSEMVAKYAEFQRWREHINSAAREST